MTGHRNGNGRMATPRAELTCRELVELVTTYLEDVMPAVELRRFEAHVEACPGCAAHLTQMRHTIEALGTLRQEEVPPHRRERLLAAFRGWQSP